MEAVGGTLMEPQRPSERQVFDFETNSWVLADSFNARAEGREIVLDAPSTEPAAGRWTKPEPQAKPTSPLVVALACAAIGFSVVALALRSGPLAALAFLCFAPVAGSVEFVKKDPRRITSEDRMLLEDPDDLDACLVLLTIVRDGRMIGTDKGVVWFADGMLLYNGHRTSFAIGGEDLLPQARWSSLAFPPSQIYLDDRTVPLRVARGSAFVRLQPLTAGAGTSPNEMRLLKRLYAFRRRPPVSKGPRQWPPFDS